MKRLPVLAFVGLALATIFAFFLTQHLKVANPVVFETPPTPAAFNPVDGRVCVDRLGQPLSFRKTTLAVRPSHAGTIGVFVVNNEGDVVATVSSGVSLKRNQRVVFAWDGLESDGRIASDGTYFFQLSLVNQGRTILLQSPITVLTHAPHPQITAVTLTAADGKREAANAAGPVVLTPSTDTLTVRYKPGAYRHVWIDVYRTDVAGRPQLVDKIPASAVRGKVVWNGDGSNGDAAPAGTYLIGITADDEACNEGRSPAVLPPAPGTTPGRGVTVRYLAATPPLVPTAAGSHAKLTVYALAGSGGSYRWALRAAGGAKVLEHGTGKVAETGEESGEGSLRVRLPKRVAGLYTLTLRARGHVTAVPLVASATGARAARARVLVVLPALTWQGQNQVDDTGDGLPDTLAAGDRISLSRPLAHGLPQGFDVDAGLIQYLETEHISFQLTTDVALAQDVGPSLAHAQTLAFAGNETWIPTSLVTRLRTFTKAGGDVLPMVSYTLRGQSQISGYPSDPVAAAPKAVNPDLLGPVSVDALNYPGMSPGETAK